MGQAPRLRGSVGVQWALDQVQDVERIEVVRYLKKGKKGEKDGGDFDEKGNEDIHNESEIEQGTKDMIETRTTSPAPITRKPSFHPTISPESPRSREPTTIGKTPSPTSVPTVQERTSLPTTTHIIQETTSPATCTSIVQETTSSPSPNLTGAPTFSPTPEPSTSTPGPPTTISTATESAPSTAIEADVVNNQDENYATTIFPRSEENFPIEDAFHLLFLMQWEVPQSLEQELPALIDIVSSKLCSAGVELVDYSMVDTCDHVSARTRRSKTIPDDSGIVDVTAWYRPLVSTSRLEQFSNFWQFNVTYAVMFVGGGMVATQTRLQEFLDELITNGDFNRALPWTNSSAYLAGHVFAGVQGGFEAEKVLPEKQVFWVQVLGGVLLTMSVFLFSVLTVLAKNDRMKRGELYSENANGFRDFSHKKSHRHTTPLGEIEFPLAKPEYDSC